jgi:hypothetical protein
MEDRQVDLIDQSHASLQLVDRLTPPFVAYASGRQVAFASPAMITSDLVSIESVIVRTTGGRRARIGVESTSRRRTVCPSTEVRGSACEVREPQTACDSPGLQSTQSQGCVAPSL